MMKPLPEIAPNTFEFETRALVKPTGFREYDARWWFGHPASSKPPTNHAAGAARPMPRTRSSSDRPRARRRQPAAGGAPHRRLAGQQVVGAKSPLVLDQYGQRTAGPAVTVEHGVQ